MRAKNNAKRVVLVLLVLGAAAAFSLPQASFAQAQPPRSRRSQRVHIQAVQVAGPDGKIKFTILPNAERLTFTVTMGNTIVIEPSPIVMKLDGYDLSSGVVFNNLERYSIDESYPGYGAHSTAVNQCNGAKISLTHDLSFTAYTLEVRVFNDGVAYRHVIPGEESTLRAPDEYSAFVIPNDSTLWYGGVADGHYETEFAKKNISEVHAGEWAGPPLTFKLPLDAGYASITEANLVNYSGMGLEADGRHGWIIGLGHRHPLNWPFELRYGRDEAKRLGKPASIAGTATTPWRVVMLGPDLNTLVNTTILTNLCPSPDPKLFAEGIRTSWIKPGRAVWRYLDGGPEGMDGMKEFSRMAGELGFEYNVIEGFWSKWTPEQRKEVIDYSRQQGVGVWFWKHSKDLRTPEAREEFFKMVHDLGVTGAKIDFFDHEAKEVIDLYEALLEKAAEYQILVVFHGANKPTGRQRAWPNELVREAIRGMESSALKERARHETILPFTRLLAGPADYTAMLFNDRRRDTTVAHQVASIAASGFWNNVCMGLSFGGRKIIASSLSTAHAIHNRTIDAKYSTAVERPTTPDTNGSGQLLRFVRVRPERKTKWHRLRANLNNYQRTQSSFVQAEFFVASDHRDLFAQSLGDDLRVLVVWGRPKRENA